MDSERSIASSSTDCSELDFSLLKTILLFLLQKVFVPGSPFFSISKANLLPFGNQDNCNVMIVRLLNLFA